MLSLIKSVGLALLLLAGANADVVDCGAGKSVLVPTKLGLEPANPKAGDETYMTVVFDNPGPEITDGTVTTSVTYNFIPFAPSTEALCSNTQCPLVTGSNDRSTSSVWPDVSGRVNTHIEWTATDGTLLLCLDVKVQTAAKMAAKGLRGAPNNITDPFPLLQFFHRWGYETMGEEMCYEEDNVESLNFSTNSLSSSYPLILYNTTVPINPLKVTIQ
jgi:hypothetical protein